MQATAAHQFADFLRGDWISELTAVFAALPPGKGMFDITVQNREAFEYGKLARALKTVYFMIHESLREVLLAALRRFARFRVRPGRVARRARWRSPACGSPNESIGAVNRWFYPGSHFPPWPRSRSHADQRRGGKGFLG